MALTRRTLLEQIGAVGRPRRRLSGDGNPGPGDSDASRSREFRASAASGNGRSVVILGAGIAGLVSAYELQRAGYRGDGARSARPDRRPVLDRSAAATASSRSAGPTRSRRFDPGLYFNAGPARIPSTHRVILGYARRFGVPLETFVNVNRNAGWDFGGKVHPRAADGQRHARPPWRAAGQGDRPHALDGAVPKDELATVRAVPRQLRAPRRRRATMRRTAGRAGSSRRRLCCRRRPASAAAHASRSCSPTDAAALALHVRASLEHAGDHAPAGRRHGSHRPCHLRAGEADGAAESPVTAIRRVGPRRADRAWPDGAIEADYCVCTLPAPSSRGSRTISRREEGRAQGRAAICTASRSRSKRRASGKPTTTSTAGSPGPTGPTRM